MPEAESYKVDYGGTSDNTFHYRFRASAENTGSAPIEHGQVGIGLDAATTDEYFAMLNRRLRAFGQPILTVKDDYEDHEAAIRNMRMNVMLDHLERIDVLRNYFNRRNLR